MISGQELVFILIIAIALLVGGERLGRLARELGKGVSGLRSELEKGTPKRAKEAPIASGERTIEAQGNISGKAVVVGHGGVIVIQDHADPPPDLGKYADAPIGVFVSSAESLAAERTTAKKAIEELAGLSRAWMAELTASTRRRPDLAADYIRRCDAFLVILGVDLPESQKTEHELAKASGKENRLYFARSEVGDDAIRAFLGDTEANVVRFSQVSELEAVIKRALVTMLINGVREKNNPHNLTKADIGKLLVWGEAFKLGENLLQYLRESIKAPKAPRSQSIPFDQPPSFKEIDLDGLILELENASNQVSFRSLRSQQTRHEINRGNKLAEEGRYREALVAYSEALELRPNSERALYQRARIYGLLGDFQQALADLDKLLQLNPNHSLRLACRGQIYRLMGNYRQALADLDKSLQRSPNSAFALRQRGAVFYLTDHFWLAWADIAKSLKLEPSSQFARQVYKLLMEM